MQLELSFLDRLVQLSKSIQLPSLFFLLQILAASVGLLHALEQSLFTGNCLQLPILFSNVLFSPFPDLFQLHQSPLDFPSPLFFLQRILPISFQSLLFSFHNHFHLLLSSLFFSLLFQLCLLTLQSLHKLPSLLFGERVGRLEMLELGGCLGELSFKRMLPLSELGGFKRARRVVGAVDVEFALDDPVLELMVDLGDGSCKTAGTVVVGKESLQILSGFVHAIKITDQPRLPKCLSDYNAKTHHFPSPSHQFIYLFI